jgi:hypothetical protein
MYVQNAGDAKCPVIDSYFIFGMGKGNPKTGIPENIVREIGPLVATVIFEHPYHPLSTCFLVWPPVVHCHWIPSTIDQPVAAQALSKSAWVK